MLLHFFYKFPSSTELSRFLVNYSREQTFSASFTLTKITLIINKAVHKRQIKEIASLIKFDNLTKNSSSHLRERNVNNHRACCISGLINSKYLTSNICLFVYLLFIINLFIYLLI